VPEPEPTIVALMRFSLGVFALYLATPILSLADCSFVGRCAGTAQLAALSPGSALCDSSSYILSCLGVATTNLYASRRAVGQRVAAQLVVSDGLAISLITGIILGLFLAVTAPMALPAFGIEQAVAEPALAYVRVRAIGAPLALLTAAAQAVCLGDRDSVTPVLVVLISGFANIIGDALLVPPFGVAGAAAATVMAQALSTAFILEKLRRRRNELAECSEGGPFGVRVDRSLSLAMPTLRASRRFLAVAVPVFVALLGKMIFVNSLTLAAAGLGTVALAAHQILFQLLLLFCGAGDALGACAQAFLPAAFVQDGHAPARRLIKKLVGVACVWGVINAFCASSLPVLVGGLFTTDMEVLRTLYPIAPLLAASLVLHCATLCLEGVLLASRRGAWLAKVYWVNSVVFVSALLVGGKHYNSLTFVWAALALFQVVRLSEFSWRVVRDQWVLNARTPAVSQPVPA